MSEQVNIHLIDRLPIRLSLSRTINNSNGMNRLDGIERRRLEGYGLASIR
ncbi:hypothetical protein [Paenibacillus lutimineralis]|nr:hypothetical protein [Paenibacillus lutimineralis]